MILNWTFFSPGIMGTDHINWSSVDVLGLHLLQGASNQILGMIFYCLVEILQDNVNLDCHKVYPFFWKYLYVIFWEFWLEAWLKWNPLSHSNRDSFAFDDGCHNLRSTEARSKWPIPGILSFCFDSVQWEQREQWWFLMYIKLPWKLID